MCLHAVHLQTASTTNKQLFLIGKHQMMVFLSLMHVKWTAVFIPTTQNHQRRMCNAHKCFLGCVHTLVWTKKHLVLVKPKGMGYIFIYHP